MEAQADLENGPKTDPKTEMRTPVEADAAKRREELAGVLQRAQQGDQTALPALREPLDANPEFWEQYGDLSLQAEAALGVKLAGSNLLLGESLKRKLQALKAELGASSSSVERLLAEQVTITWQQTHYYNSLITEAGTASPARLKTLQALLDAAQRRHLASLKALAAVRKLLRPAPAPIDFAGRRPAAGARGGREGIGGRGLPVRN
jgi:hypothetical protein